MIQKVSTIQAMRVLLTTNERRFNAYPQAKSEWARLMNLLDNPWKICEESFNFQMAYSVDDQIAFDIFNGTFLFSTIVKDETYTSFFTRVSPQVRQSRQI